MTAVMSDFLQAGWTAALAPAAAMAVGKSMLALVVGFACAWMFRSASAATRHLVWTLVLGTALVGPALAALLPRWETDFVPPRVWHSLGVRAPEAPARTVIATPRAPRQLRRGDLVPAVAQAAASGQPAAAPLLTVETVAATVAAAAEPAAPAVVVAPAGVAAVGEVGARPVSIAAVAPPVLAGGEATVAPVEPAPTAAVSSWLVIVWLGGIVLALVPVVAGLVRVRAIARASRPARGGRWSLLIPVAMREVGVVRRVRFLESDAAAMPMTWGIFRPVVLLPGAEFEATTTQRLDILRHELAHVRRYDCLTQLIAQVVCAVYWFNPLAWIAARQLRVERERACDDEVLRAGAKASDYAAYLLDVARSTRLTPVAAFGGLAMARPSQLSGRLLAVLDDRRSRERVSTGVAVPAFVVAAVLAIALGALSPTSASAGGVVEAGSAAEVRRTPVVAMARASTSARIAAAVTDDPSVDATTVPPGGLAPAFGYAAELPVGQPGPCERRASRSSSHSNWTNTDDGRKRWRVNWTEGDCSYEIDARGEVTFNRDATDVEAISRGGAFTLEQHIGDDTRRLVIRPRDDGALDRVYAVNGERREYDATARAWFAEALVALDRQTAFAVDRRLPAILERGGVDAALQEISLLRADYARRRYYNKLLAARQLDRSQIRRVVEDAAAAMSSDYELAQLLVDVSKLDAFGDDSHAAFVAATGTIGSDYERRRALSALLQRDRLAPATVEALLRAAAKISSDYELAELLIDVSKRYAIDDRTRPVYLEAVGSIASDYEHRRVLNAIVKGGGLTSAVTRALLEDARRIGSDYELAEFLITVGRARGLDASTSEAYFAAANKIGSDYEHRRALTPLLSKELLTKDLVRSILASAAKIDSDYECAELLIAVARAYPIDDELRADYERAAESIKGEYEYGRAMGALRRRVSRSI